MIVAVHQPQYFPWLGYFDKILQADIFVLLDTVQFKKNEWQNRNRIKTSQGWQWLTVPVQHQFGQRIHNVKICTNQNWRTKHLNALKTNYSNAAFFDRFWPEFEEIFTVNWENLSALNIFIIKKLLKLLNITTEVHIASQLPDLPDTPDGRLIKIVEYFEADTYLAGQGGKSYMDLTKYKKSKMEVLFQDYSHPVYSQLFGNFEPYMSVLDLLFNCGDESLDILSSKERVEYEYSGNWRASGRY